MNKEINNKSEEKNCKLGVSAAVQAQMHCVFEVEKCQQGFKK